MSKLDLVEVIDTMAGALEPFADWWEGCKESCQTVQEQKHFLSSGIGYGGQISETASAPPKRWRYSKRGRIQPIRRNMNTTTEKPDWRIGKTCQHKKQMDDSMTTRKHRRKDALDRQRPGIHAIRPNLLTVDRVCPACALSVTLGRIGGRDSTEYQAFCQCGLELRAVWPSIVFGYRAPADPQHRNGTLEADAEAMPDYEVYA